MLMVRRRRLAPTAVPILLFAGAILVGSVLLRSPFAHREGLSWIDAIFTAVSATCVTGLTVVDTGNSYTAAGQSIILVLIQLGGLGIMTFTSLAIVAAGRSLSLSDRLAVGRSLLQDPRISIGRFLRRVVTFTVIIELLGAGLLWLCSPVHFSPFSAVFHAISAFCNAGFSLNSDNLAGSVDDLLVNGIIMALIILGGVGFVVLVEGQELVLRRLRGQEFPRVSDHFRIVVQTSVFLVVAGAGFFFFAESVHPNADLPESQRLLSSLFHSVSARTAGFNTIPVGQMTNVSLLFLMVLMFIGGAPGSCAGGIKVTTFRVLAAFVWARMRGRRQVTMSGHFAVSRGTVDRAVTLLFLALVLIAVSTLILDFSEGGRVPHPQARGQFLEILFEVVSAFGTVGLSTGLTPGLSVVGKIVLIILMFVGRLGPLVLMTALHEMQAEIRYALPEQELNVG